MPKITEIYEHYKLMPQLQMHQLRVAAVAKLLCDNLEPQVDEPTIITACLLHDMGNIIKANLAYFPEFLEPEGLEYWQKIQDEFVQKYGRDEHHATVAIVKELGLTEKIVALVDRFGFSRAAENEKLSLEVKVAVYSDMRVGPHGVLSLDERLADGKERYKNHKDIEKLNSGVLDSALRRIEQEIFSQAKIKSADITNQSIAPITEQLKYYEI